MLTDVESATPELDLAGAVIKAQNGDHAAFTTVYQRFATPIYQYLYVRCLDVHLAEELAADVWLRVVEGLPRFRFAQGAPDTVFAAWLYRIARNVLIDSYRAHKGKRDLAPLTDTEPARDESPDEQALAAEERQELRAAMDYLTDEQREVLLLRFVEQRSSDEVALLTERTEGAVKGMQFRALNALARALGVRRGRR